MKKEKCEKALKFTIFSEKDPNLVIYKLSKSLEYFFFHNIKAQLEVSIGKNFQQKWKYRQRDKGKQPFKFANIQTLTNCFDRYIVIVRM